MITLAFDTCLDKMYVVLKKDGEILASKTVENHDNKYHSAFLISTLQEVMCENDVKPQDVDLIGVNIGPGSFTGIRACVTVARVMAQQLNCKVAGVSSLEILAETYYSGHSEQSIESHNIIEKIPLVALDARKNCAYLYSDNEIKGAIPLEEVQKYIQTGKYDVITDDKLQPILGGVSYQKQNFPLGEILAQLAEEKEETNWRLLKPLYIQPPPMG